MTIMTRIPVVGGLAYIERVRGLPASFVATLIPRPEQRYFPQAIAVTVEGQTLGYVAPEVARSYFEVVSGAQQAVTCPARRASTTDHETSGVELLLDFSALPAPSA